MDNQRDGIIDLHTHILPGIDDGSRDTDESLRMLLLEQLQGVDRIVFTPHFYAEREGKSFFKKRKASYDRLMGVVKGTEAYSMTFRLGAEVCYFTGIGKASLLPELCIANMESGRVSEYMLLEMPFSQWDASVVCDVKMLIHDQGVKPIIAHIERYFPFQRDRSYWYEIFDLPVIPQMNAGAFVKGIFEKRKNYRLLRDMDIVMGSDCHNSSSRSPNMDTGRKAIEKQFGKEILVDIDELSERVFEGL